MYRFNVSDGLGQPQALNIVLPYCAIGPRIEQEYVSRLTFDCRLLRLTNDRQ